MRRACLISVLALSIATACTPGERPREAASRPVRLRLLQHIYQPAVEEMARAIKEYEKRHENVKIEQIAVPSNEFVARGEKGLASGEIDLSTQEAPLASFFASGAVAPVDFEALGYRSRDAFEAKFIDGALVPFTYKGTLYAVPSGQDCLALYINKSLFRQAGLDADKDYPRTWEDVLSVSRRILKRDRLGRIIRGGFDFTYPSGGTDDPTSLGLYPMIAQKGGSIISSDGKRSTFDSPASVAVFRFLKDWVYRYRLGDPMGKPSYSRFIDGSLAMIAKGPWVERLLQDRAPAVYDNLLIVPFPVFSGASIPYGAPMDAYGFLVNARSSPDVQREAWKFIAFLSRDPVERFRRVGGFVLRKEVFERVAEIERSFKFASVWLDMVKRPQMQLWEVPQAAAINEAIDDAIVAMATKDLTPEQAVAQASAAIQKVLDGSG